MTKYVAIGTKGALHHTHIELGDTTMAESIDFIQERSIATFSAQGIVANEWMWSEKSLAQWEAELAALQAQKKILSKRDTDVAGARGMLDVAVASLHEQTAQGLSMAKSKYRGQPVEAHVLKTLSANSTSRVGVLEEALEWEVAWEELDAAWEPVAGNTLAALKARREACAGLIRELAKARMVVRRETKRLSQLAAALDDSNVAWYDSAVHVFGDETSAGAMIRGTIPTTYSPAKAEAEPAPPEV